jgi:hypothetical protein
MRAFVRMRKLIQSNREMLDKVNKLEERYDENFVIIFRILDELIQDPQPKVTPKKIGFRLTGEE